MTTKSTLAPEEAVALGKALGRPMLVDWLNRWLLDGETLERVTPVRMDCRVLTLPVLKHMNGKD